jgi:hypothetical protein
MISYRVKMGRHGLQVVRMVGAPMGEQRAASANRTWTSRIVEWLFLALRYIGAATANKSAHFDGGGLADLGLGVNVLTYGIANTGVFTVL